MSRAVIYAVVADILFALLDGTVKSVAQRYPVLEIAFLRFFLGALFASLLVAYVRPGWPSSETIRYNTLRSFLVVVTATTFYYALSVLGFAEAVALSFLSPIFVVLFGALILGETIDKRIIIGLATGFGGMLVMVVTQFDLANLGGTRAEVSEDFILGVGAVLISAVSYAFVLVILRARATRDALEIIVWFQNIVPALLLAVPAAFVWVTPSPIDCIAFVVIGLLGVGGHLMMARAFAEAQAARLAPLHYLALVWSSIIGYVAFSEIPTPGILLGAVLIVIGTYVTQRR